MATQRFVSGVLVNEKPIFVDHYLKLFCTAYFRDYMELVKLIFHTSGRFKWTAKKQKVKINQ